MITPTSESEWLGAQFGVQSVALACIAWRSCLVTLDIEIHFSEAGVMYRTSGRAIDL